jgi:hypothetical protein
MKSTATVTSPTGKAAARPAITAKTIAAQAKPRAIVPVKPAAPSSVRYAWVQFRVFNRLLTDGHKWRQEVAPSPQMLQWASDTHRVTIVIPDKPMALAAWTLTPLKGGKGAKPKHGFGPDALSDTLGWPHVDRPWASKAKK